MRLATVAAAALAALSLSTAVPADAHPRHGKGKTWSFSFDTSGGRLGAQVQPMTPELRRYFGAPDDAGVLVGGVDPDAPAAKVLRAGDVIVEVEGKAVDAPHDVLSALAGKGEGDEATVVVVRDKKKVTLKTKLAAGGFAWSGDPDTMGFSFGAPGGVSVHMLGEGKLREKLQKMEKRLDDLEQRLKKLEK
jgi:hypothetical protein